MSALLQVSGLEARYGSSQALFGVDLEVASGEVVALMGRNGMGKTTTVRCICRMMRAEGRLGLTVRICADCRRTGRRGWGSGWCPRDGGVLRI